MITTANQQQFSIYNDMISTEHREFYERIINDLLAIKPICNQGKSTAAEISETATEQEQITDLMERVERFAEELHNGTKNLFDQFYLAKEDFCRSIYCTTAFIKVNLIDRTLLERTCDVRWWANESAFGDALELTRSLRANIGNKVEEVKEFLDAARTTFEIPTLETDWTSRDISRYVQAVNQYFDSPLELMFDRKLFAKFERHVNELIEQFGLGKGQDRTIKKLKNVVNGFRAIHEAVDFACQRLEDILSSYTVYRDLVVTTEDGVVIANARPESRARLLGKSINDEGWFANLKGTIESSHYAIQQSTQSLVEATNSLVFSAGIREGSHVGGEVLGNLVAFFDLEEESNIILQDYMPRSEDDFIRDGWYSFLTDEEGKVVGSSDPSIIEIGSSAHVPKKHLSLSGGQTASSYAYFEGMQATVFSAKSNGYLDFRGLGWTSHLVVPTTDIFTSDKNQETDGIGAEQLMRSRLIPEINKQTYVKVQDDKQSIKLISLNGIVFASKLGKRGVALGPVFDQITNTGDFATSKMEELLREMANGELRLNLKTLETFSKQAIDLIDRNLFERAAAIRWWSTDRFLVQALADPTEENILAASNRLRDINASYTVYRNLLLADKMGRLITASSPEMIPDFQELRVADHPWFINAIRATSAAGYEIQDIGQSEFERQKQSSLIYSGAIYQDTHRQEECLGVLGSLFDWATEAQKILRTCLPKDKFGRRIKGCVAFYTNANGDVIETTDPEVLPANIRELLPARHLEIEAGQSASGVLAVDGKTYILGTSGSQGYREYRGLGWAAHIMRPLN